MKLAHPFLLTAAITAVSLLTTVLAQAESIVEPQVALDAANSDPVKMGWMIGAPPPANRILRPFDMNAYRFPAMRWSASNFRQLMPTVNVSRGLGAPKPLPRSLRNDIDSLMFTPLNSTKPMSWESSLSANYTDGIVVLHKGRIIYERYFGALTESGQHGAMSVTKSFIGTLATMLIAEGQLEANAPVAKYLPEFSQSAFGDATIQQVLDMTTALKFSEDFSDPKADIWAHAQAGNAAPKPKDFSGPRSYFEFLKTIKKQGQHGQAFAYKTANTDALGQVIHRVTGQSVAQLLSSRIWSKIGAEQDSYFQIDSTGAPFAGGGLNTGLRDLARFGELIRNDGELNGQQIIAKAVVQEIKRGGDSKLFAKSSYNKYKQFNGWSYHNMWWHTHNNHSAFAARGVYGQTIYIDPKADMVIARYASHPRSGNVANDPTSLPAYQALAEYLLTL